jgi:hypothetical protein
MTTFAVFFPALMGAGILVSGVLLLSDAVRRLMPNHGRQRRYRNAVGTYGIVAATARTVGVSIHRPSFLTRRPRSAVAYIAVAAVGILLAAISLSTGLDAYEDPLSVFSGSPWAIGIGVAAFVCFLLISVIALVLVALGSSDLRVVRWIVEHSPFGRVSVPERVSVGFQARKDEP